MSLRMIDGEDGKALQCFEQDKFFHEEECEGLFMIGINGDGQAMIACYDCGEEYEMAYALNVLNGKET